MKIINYSKLKKFSHFESLIEKSDFMTSTFDIFSPPLKFYKLWYDKYINNSSKIILDSVYFWDSSKSLQSNQSELFRSVDLMLYFIQPFDYSHSKNWNPISYFNKEKCHSEDLIVVTFKNYNNNVVLSEFKFKRGSYLKMNLHCFLDHILEYAYNKEIKIEIKYLLSVEGSNYFTVIENQLSLINKYDMKIYESIIKNLHFSSKTDFCDNPDNYNEELKFISKVEDHFQNFKIFEENLYFIKQFKVNRSIEYLFLLNADFEHFEDKKTLNFQVLNHRIIDAVLKKIIKALY